MLGRYTPRWDIADRLCLGAEETIDVFEFHGDGGASSVEGDLEDPHKSFQSFDYPGYGPGVPAGYPHGPFVEPDMGFEEDDGVGGLSIKG